MLVKPPFAAMEKAPSNAWGFLFESADLEVFLNSCFEIGVFA